MLIVDRKSWEPVTELQEGLEVYLTFNDDFFPYIVRGEGFGLKWLVSPCGNVGVSIEGPDENGHYHGSCFLDLRRVHLMDFN
jgi:hypothetical protein